MMIYIQEVNKEGRNDASLVAVVWQKIVESAGHVEIK